METFNEHKLSMNWSLRDWRIKWIQREELDVLPLYFGGCDEVCHSLVWLQCPVAHGISAVPGRTSCYWCCVTHTHKIHTCTNLSRALLVLLGYLCYHWVLQEFARISVTSKSKTAKINKEGCFYSFICTKFLLSCITFIPYTACSCLFLASWSPQILHLCF